MIAHGEEMGIDFERLHQAQLTKSLLMVQGGFCHYHKRRDGQITIHVLLSSRPGAGQEMLAQLLALGGTFLQAVCPADLPSNAWYAKRGFVLAGAKQSSKGRQLNIWRLQCTNI